MIKSGTRMKSQVDGTEVIVIRSADGLSELCCGGAPMVSLETAADEILPDPELTSGTVLGKRYVDGAAAEVLVTKAGVGTLTIGGTPLTVKEAKPLPASD